MGPLAIALLVSSARGEVRCEEGQVHATIAAAVADGTCSAIALGAGTFDGRVDIARPFVVSGAGVGQTTIQCAEGPCLAITGGAEVAIRGVTLASGGTAVSVRDATLALSDATLKPIDRRGGWLRLKDSNATLTGVRVEMGARHPLPIEAVSSIGHDLTLSGVTFVGYAPESNTRAFVYSVAYGVVCQDCRFVVP